MTHCKTCSRPVLTDTNGTQPLSGVRILALIVFVISLFKFTSSSQAEGVVAIVNKDVISIGQVRAVTQEKEQELRTRFQFGELQKKIKELRLAAINDLIDRQLILQEFQSKGYEIPNATIDERISSIIKEEFAGDAQAFERSVAAQNYTLERFKSRERDKIIVQEMQCRATEGIASVPEAEIAGYYKKHDDQYSSSTLKDAHEEIKRILLQNAREEAIKDWIKKLRKPAYIHMLSGHPYLEQSS